MNTFDYNDYVDNFRKYELFKTAVLNCTIINERGSVKKGTVVGIKLIRHDYSPFYSKNLPLYQLSTGDFCWGNKLTNFVL
jgi:hypothetical protein